MGFSPCFRPGPAVPAALLCVLVLTSSMVLLCARSGLSLRFQRCDLWLRPPSSSLSVVSCRATRGRLRLRELIRWREPGSWSLDKSGLKARGHMKNMDLVPRERSSSPAVCILDISICIALALRVGQDALLLQTHESQRERQIYGNLLMITASMLLFCSLWNLGESSSTIFKPNTPRWRRSA